MQEAVAREGIISFARFMELALYCPKFGYYERLNASPGQKGDYYTSVSTGGLFGELLAWQFAEWASERPGQPWQILEAGAHDGRLAGDILRWLTAHLPGFLQQPEYWILEPSAKRRQIQEVNLTQPRGGVPVRWFDSWDALPPMGLQGVIFSNELLDAMPVHRLGWDAARKQWFEWGVGVHAGEFSWERMPEPTDAALDQMLPELPNELLAVLPDGFVTEVGPATVDWWRRAARTLKNGRLVAFDYGLEAQEFFTPERKAGTLRAYYRHQVSEEILARAGEQDITSHVNFSAIRNAGLAEGLQTESLATQARFLTGIVQWMFKRDAACGKWLATQTRQFHTLTHPEHLGRAFHALVQKR